MKACYQRLRAPAPGTDLPRAGTAAGTGAAALRALLLGVAVFTVAVIGAGLLAGAAPATPAAPTPTQAADPSDPAVTVASQQPQAADPELVFAQSMIYSGVTALALSLAGTVMVMRRRRYW